MNVLKISFGGSIGRTEYWARLAMGNAFLAMLVVFLWAFSLGASDVYQSALVIAGVILLIYTIVYSWNNILGRLRDAQLRPFAWVAGIIFLPLINIILFIIIGCFKTPGEQGKASPKDRVIVFVSACFWLLSVLAISFFQIAMNQASS
jgi:uncharacterized membrane protein YhaH (DUF805 family)